MGDDLWTFPDIFPSRLAPASPQRGRHDTCLASRFKFREKMYLLGTFLALSIARMRRKWPGQETESCQPCRTAHHSIADPRPFHHHG